MALLLPRETYSRILLVQIGMLQLSIFEDPVKGAFLWRGC